MVAVSNHISAAAPDRQLLTKRVIWEQNEPLLDVVQQGDRTAVLSSGKLTIIQAGKRSDLVIDIPPMRDPRGRLELAGNALTAYFPGATCRGTMEPPHLDCDDASAEFLLNGEQVHFTPGRNTIAGIRPGDETASVCEGMKLAAVKEDVLALLDHTGVTREEAELPGTITALWPAAEGAVAVVRNRQTEQYTAYAISVACDSH
ncbi:MAG: hypothetical protein JOZ62_22925 [Acidobacteriaceae bacterium]|nr:hypothetical protein [Acidobacteriaceae bacterium]